MQNMMFPLAERLRAATRSLHGEVERAGVMRMLLQGDLPRASYCALLANLHVVYGALETGLLQHAAHRQLAPLVRPELFRVAALECDLAQIHGSAWTAAIKRLPAAMRYAGHLEQLAECTPTLLAAHAYVRYLGDLNGGQVLARVVARSLKLTAGTGVAFYDFGGRDQAALLACGLRAGLDRIAGSEAEAQAIVAEACDGFGRHRQLFEELAADAPAVVWSPAD